MKTDHTKKRVQKLMQRVQSNRQKRENALAQSKWYQERCKVIREARTRAPMDFWCIACARDFTCVDSLKIVKVSKEIPRAYYEGMCPAKHLAIRYITDKYMDPYYHLSAMLRQQRYEMKDDLLTPADPRFKVVYPKQWAQLEADKEMRQIQEEAENTQLYG